MDDGKNETTSCASPVCKSMLQGNEIMASPKRIIAVGLGAINAMSLDLRHLLRGDDKKCKSWMGRYAVRLGDNGRTEHEYEYPSFSYFLNFILLP